MAHITFIHGISNKPSRDRLVEIWLGALANSSGLDLGGLGVSVEMVYWADVLYEEPLADDALEAAGAAVEAPESQGAASAPVVRSATEASFTAGLAMKFGAIAALAEAENAAAEDALERIPLPDFLKKRLMEAYLRDVHHYLFNVQFTPRPGETYQVQDEIRRRTIALLRAGAQKPGPHVVVSHSMGTVIAYDCLKRVADCPAVDGLMTIGSPLGLDEVQDQLAPEWTRADGYPSGRLHGSWVNVFDRLDPVAGFDAYLTNDFQRAGQATVQDIHEPNYGKWRHDISKYLGGAQLRTALAQLLGL